VGLHELNRVTHALIFSAGWLSFSLGAIGVVLPVLPTTPFMILAAACFAKTSPRFHKWLLANKVFGPLIKNWQEERFIERRVKMRALAIIALTFIVSIMVVSPMGLKVMLMVCWLVCTVSISRLPTIPKSQKGS
jgi:uncharacterized membrane protein YbaN (DUF454 family)